MTKIAHGVDMIAVEWQDSYISDNYFDLDEGLQNHHALVVMQNVGYLVYEDDEKIILSLEWQVKWRRFKHLFGVPKVNIIRQKRWKLRMAAPPL